MTTHIDTSNPLPLDSIAKLPFSLTRLLVATDGSESGNRAVSFAVALAARHACELELCCVIDRTAAVAECSSIDAGANTLMPMMEALEDTARVALAKASELAKGLGFAVMTSTLEGHPARAIVDRANDRAFDAIVIGTRGTHGIERLVLGSTADGVLRRTEVPVFVIPPGAEVTGSTFDRFIVAIDDSDPADAAATFSIALANALKAKLLFCGVAETKYLVSRGAMFAFDATPMLAELREHVRERLQTYVAKASDWSVSCESVVIDGEPIHAILSLALSEQAGMLVIGTHGRRGLQRFFIGSVSESVVQMSQVPVVVVRKQSGAPGRNS